jgi:hypothetical protein
MENKCLKVRPPFCPFLYNIGQNSAVDLSARSTFYSATFELCGRTIGQLPNKTKLISVTSEGRRTEAALHSDEPLFHAIRPSFRQRIQYIHILYVDK